MKVNFQSKYKFISASWFWLFNWGRDKFDHCQILAGYQRYCKTLVLNLFKFKTINFLQIVFRTKSLGDMYSHNKSLTTNYIMFTESIEISNNGHLTSLVCNFVMNITTLLKLKPSKIDCRANLESIF